MLGNLHGIKISREAPAISHLIFADDTILFCRANQEEATAIDKCLKIYEEWSGQCISKGKSGVVFSPNTGPISRKSILEVLRMGTLSREKKYLGIPLFSSRIRCADFQFLKEKVLSRLEGWKAKLLSRVRRIVLIQLVIQSILSYTMSTFKVPATICQGLDAAARMF
ncbi:hypothetical protein TorRG33x02_341560 [Trema orientale]|uniref:Reverse transcriptase domain-containing protein n=1 Tax=Trema orientale TaxID=63057 RepID=A0A2P5ATQ1_TREOI|nr:hypothetical protein TorRG33x02_341560 [Trema orientale]